MARGATGGPGIRLSRSNSSARMMRSDPMDTGSLPIMTYRVLVITGGSHAPEEFYPHRPPGPPLRRRDPSGPSPTPGPWTEVPRRPAADPAVLRRRPHHLALGRLQVPARCPLRRGGPPGPDRHLARLRRVAAPAQRRPGRRPAPAPASPAAAPGRRPGPGPLPWQPLRDPDEIYRSAAKSGTSHFHAYATLYVIHRGYRFTVALTAVAGGEPLEGVLKRLLHQAAAVGVRCRLLLLDRGFYSVGVIRYLQAARRP